MDMHAADKVDNLIYDIGMHRGEDTDFYLKKGFRVIGFEADPELAAHCQDRFSEQITGDELTVVEGAILQVADNDYNPGTVTFYRNRDHSVWGTVMSSWAHRNELLGTVSEKIEVPVINFTDCLMRYGIPHYMKIDIEGMDLVCLQALLNFQHKPDFISVEAQKVVYNELVTELNLLSQLGYNKFKAVQQSGISRQREPNPTMEGRYANYRFKNGGSGLFGHDLPLHWQTQQQITKQYKNIFWQYRLFGDNAVLPHFAVGRFLIKVLSKLLDKPVPGWYDTHAKHACVATKYGAPHR